MSLDPTMLIADVLARWPKTAAVILRRKLDCVGCAMAPYDTVQDVAETYHIDLATLVAELEAAIASPEVADIQD